MKVQLTLKLMLLVGLVLLGGCAGQRTVEPFYTRLYEGNYDDVWMAALKALNDYPLKITNKDTGKVHSEQVSGPYNDIYFTYPEPIELPERFRFSMKLNFAKFEVEGSSRFLTRVRIIKDLEKFQDFYTGWTPISSDGLEERLILYRIEHILRMDQQLSSAGSH